MRNVQIGTIPMDVATAELTLFIQALLCPMHDENWYLSLMLRMLAALWAARGLFKRVSAQTEVSTIIRGSSKNFVKDHDI